MDKIIFEHPLNEKMRTWLRVEFLLKQLHVHYHCDEDSVLSFFHSLSELLEIIERNDVKGELIKEIESQKQKLLAWTKVDGVDQSLLDELLNKFNVFLTKLSASARLGQPLKEDKFITAIRQRLMIPGGCCSFDLPSFYLWIKIPQEKRNKQVQDWLSHLTILDDTITTCMQLIRESGQFNEFCCENNFFQETDGDINLIRIRVGLDKNVYPQVSGYKSRYSIRFLPLDTSSNEKLEPIEFELACC